MAGYNVIVDYVVGFVVSVFDQYVWLDGGDGFQWCVFVEDYYQVDKVQSFYDQGVVVFVLDGV